MEKKISETWKTKINFLEENNGEMEIEVECRSGKEKKVFSGFLSEI